MFIDISELIILIPILLNLKGNLEMNLASRLSTAVSYLVDFLILSNLEEHHTHHSPFFV